MIMTSDTTSAITAALVAAQLAIGGGVSKNRQVTAGARRYAYADLAAVIDAAAAPMHAAGLAWISSVGEHGVVVRLVHTSGEWIEVRTGVLVSGDDPQRAGSALTYGRRYGLLSLLGLAQEDDDGARARRPDAPKATGEAHHAAIRAAIQTARSRGMTIEDVTAVLESMGHSRVGSITSAEAPSVLAALADASGVTPEVGP